MSQAGRRRRKELVRGEGGGPTVSAGFRRGSECKCVCDT